MGPVDKKFLMFLYHNRKLCLWGVSQIIVKHPKCQRHGQSPRRWYFWVDHPELGLWASPVTFYGLWKLLKHFYELPLGDPGQWVKTTMLWI